MFKLYRAVKAPCWRIFMKYTARIDYDSKTSLRLSKMQQRLFNIPLEITGYVLSAFLIVSVFFLGCNTTSGLLFLAAGCLMITNIDAPAKHRVKQLEKMLKGYVPTMEYTFYGKDFESRTVNEYKRCDYNDLIRIVDDGKYFYLFPNKQSCYMVDLASLMPNDTVGFRKLIEESSGLKVTVPFSFLKNGLYTLIKNRKNTRQ